jgi:hypothetical protein
VNLFLFILILVEFSEEALFGWSLQVDLVVFEIVGEELFRACYLIDKPIVDCFLA